MKNKQTNKNKKDACSFWMYDGVDQSGTVWGPFHEGAQSFYPETWNNKGNSYMFMANTIEYACYAVLFETC